jgi:hypothetical protein
VRHVTLAGAVLDDHTGVSSAAHAIRPIRPSDKSALVRFHARLSPDALYRRYHGSKAS